MVEDVAQSVEHQIFNLAVEGSNPSVLTNPIKQRILSFSQGERRFFFVRIFYSDRIGSSSHQKEALL